jgi:hypothetical protein
MFSARSSVRSAFNCRSASNLGMPSPRPAITRRRSAWPVRLASRRFVMSKSGDITRVSLGRLDMLGPYVTYHAPINPDSRSNCDIAGSAGVELPVPLPDLIPLPWPRVIGEKTSYSGHRSISEGAMVKFAHETYGPQIFAICVFICSAVSLALPDLASRDLTNKSSKRFVATRQR